MADQLGSPSGRTIARWWQMMLATLSGVLRVLDNQMKDVKRFEELPMM